MTKKKKRIVIIGGSVVLFLIAFTLIFVFVILPLLRDDDDGNKFTITSVEIQYQGETITELTRQAGTQSFQLSILVNDGELSADADYTVEWDFVGSSFNSTITDGLVSLANVIGQTTVRATVQSENEMAATVLIRVLANPAWTIEGLTLSDDFEINTYIEGQSFETDKYTIYADFGAHKIRVMGFDIDPEILSVEDTWVLVSFMGEYLQIPVNVVPRTLQSISIVAPPTKTTYIVGEYFESAGMAVKAHFEFINEEVDNFFWNPNGQLTIEDTSVTILFTENNVTRSVTQPITVVSAQVQSLAVNFEKVRVDYVQGQRFDPTGLVVTAHFDNGTSEVVTDYTIDVMQRLDTRLRPVDTHVVIEYGGRDFILPINVELPFETTRTINIADPQQVVLSWTFYFMTDDGVDKLERNAYSPDLSEILDRDLVFCRETGEFEIPVGAIVSITAINPAIFDFALDETRQNIVHPTRTISFTMSPGEDMDVSTIMLTDRRTIIFTDGETNLAFSYPVIWDGILFESHLAQIAFFFEGVIGYRIAYTVGGVERSFAELIQPIDTFAEFIVITIERHAIEAYVGVNVKLWEDMEFIVFIPQADFTSGDWHNHLPDVSRIGYVFNGWTTLSEFEVRANWNRDTISYSGHAFVGTWSTTLSDSTIQTTIVLNADGTYIYTTRIDGEVNLSFEGFFRFDDETNSLVFLSIRTDDDLILVTLDDLHIDLNEPLLTANVLFSEDLSLVEIIAIFARVS